MARNFSAIICTCELDNGYILKNFFGFNSLRGRPIITFCADKITGGNRTADDQLYGSGYLYGDETSLVWDENIPIDQRSVSLAFDATRLQGALSRIRKKDPSRITITQIRNMDDPHNFCGPNSSDEFIIYVSCGEGGDGREGLKSVPANRTVADNTLIRYPEKYRSAMLVIPVKKFRSMVDSFGKCKKETIRMCFYPNISSDSNGREVRGRPGITISTDGSGPSGRIFEKFGEVPEEEGTQTILPMIQLNNLKLDEANIVRNNNPGVQPAFEIVKMPEPNEFLFDADKIGVFSKMASMHNEGNVRINYQRNSHLRIAHRFGAFGESELCLSNAYVKFDDPNGKTKP